jgi:hypothetical protein
MRQNDWFNKLDFAYQGAMAWQDENARQQLLATLAALEKMLDGAASPRGFSAIPWLYGFNRVAHLRADERQWAERLCERLWKVKGTGRIYAEEALLGLVGAQASPDSLPFFRAALETHRERDSFQARRRSIAVASVAFIAHQTGDAAAHAQLEAWLAHPDVTVRTEAVALYGHLHLQENERVEEATIAMLTRVAYEDRAFAPRFLARDWLHTTGVPIRIEPPNGVYAFKVSLGRASRTVELTASQRLDDLASAILHAFGWDHDHLYEFALTGDLRDRRFVLPDTKYEPPGFAMGAGRAAEQKPPDSPPSLMNLPLGALGLTKGHKFIFHYDFGDNHHFQVTVVDVHAHRDSQAEYPRVVARLGKAPEQYPRYD